MKVKIILADDHRILADALASLLSPHFELLALANDGLALLDEARKLNPDIIVADIEMPNFTGMDALHQLKKEGLKSKVIFLTMHAEPQIVRAALASGAAGYLLKESAGEELITAIHEVMKGNIYISPAITRDLLTIINERGKKSKDQLTVRQRQVLRLIAEGQSMKEIAAVLKISARTVETYKYEMMRNLGVKTTAELIRYSLRQVYPNANI
jgi:DNA-binding NarL/FixJ family response regulator